MSGSSAVDVDDNSINALRQSANFMLDQWGCSPADDKDLERLLSAMGNADDLWTAGDILNRELGNLALEKLRTSYDAGNEAALISAMRLWAPGKKRPCKVRQKRVMPDWVAAEVDRVFPKGRRLAELRRRNPKLWRLVVEIRFCARQKRVMPDWVAVEFRRETHPAYSDRKEIFCGLLRKGGRLAALKKQHTQLKVYRRITDLHQEGQPIYKAQIKVAEQMEMTIGRCKEYYYAARRTFDPLKSK